MPKINVPDYKLRVWKDYAHNEWQLLEYEMMVVCGDPKWHLVKDATYFTDDKEDVLATRNERNRQLKAAGYTVVYA